MKTTIRKLEYPILFSDLCDDIQSEILSLLNKPVTVDENSAIVTEIKLTIIESEEKNDITT